MTKPFVICHMCTTIDGKVLSRQAHSVRRGADVLGGVSQIELRHGGEGGGQFDLTRDGALVYVPGVNAEVGRLVRRASGGRRSDAIPVLLLGERQPQPREHPGTSAPAALDSRSPRKRALLLMP